VALFERRPATTTIRHPPSAKPVRSDFNVLARLDRHAASHASFTAMAPGIPSICMDGGMSLEWFQSGAVTDDMKQVAVRKHYVAKRVFGPNAKTCASPRNTAPNSPIASRGASRSRRCRASFDPYKIINFARTKSSGQQSALLSVPDRRIQRRSGRGLGERQARPSTSPCITSAAA